MRRRASTGAPHGAARSSWRGNFLTAAAVATVLAGIDLLARIGQPPHAPLQGSGEHARSVNPPNLAAAADDDRESPEASARERPWSPESVELAAPDPERTEARAPSLDDHDPTRWGPAPNPFLEPKQHLTVEETRAGLDSRDGASK